MVSEAPGNAEFLEFVIKQSDLETFYCMCRNLIVEQEGGGGGFSKQ